MYSNAPGSNCGDTSTLSFNVITCLGNITGTVRDVEGNGIPSVNVRLYRDLDLDGVSDGGSAVRSVFTTSEGVYSMATLTPGQYVIVQTQPSGYLSVEELDETDDSDTLVVDVVNDNVIPVTVEPQEVDANNVFVEIPSPGLISGSVFEDFDGDEVPDAAEGIVGVTISLWLDEDADGEADDGGFVSDTVTTETGYYVFPSVVPGNYVIIESHPAGYESVKDFDATNDGDDVPNTNTLNDTIPVTVDNGEEDNHNYFIETTLCSRVVTNDNDDGPGSLRYNIGCAAPGDTITFHSSMQGQTIHLNSGRIIIDKDLFIHSDLVSPSIMIYSDISGALLIEEGNAVELKNIEITSGLSGELGAAIENAGNLTLWDMTIFANPLLPPEDYLIYNASTGEITVKGNCHIWQ